MTSVQENIDLGMSITKALEIATTINTRLDGTNHQIYDQILDDAQYLQPKIHDIIKKIKQQL